MGVTKALLPASLYTEGGATFNVSQFWFSILNLQLFNIWSAPSYLVATLEEMLYSMTSQFGDFTLLSKVSLFTTLYFHINISLLSQTWNSFSPRVFSENGITLFSGSNF